MREKQVRKTERLKGTEKDRISVSVRGKEKRERGTRESYQVDIAVFGLEENELRVLSHLLLFHHLFSCSSSSSFSSPSLGVILARALLARERDTRVGVRILKEEDVYEGVESHDNKRLGGWCS